MLMYMFIYLPNYGQTQLSLENNLVTQLCFCLHQPLVGHNILTDLMLTYEKFYKPLPGNSLLLGSLSKDEGTRKQGSDLLNEEK